MSQKFEWSRGQLKQVKGAHEEALRLIRETGDKGLSREELQEALKNYRFPPALWGRVVSGSVKVKGRYVIRKRTVGGTRKGVLAAELRKELHQILAEEPDGLDKETLLRVMEQRGIPRRLLSAIVAGTRLVGGKYMSMVKAQPVGPAIRAVGMKPVPQEQAEVSTRRMIVPTLARLVIFPETIQTGLEFGEEVEITVSLGNSVMTAIADKVEITIKR